MLDILALITLSLLVHFLEVINSFGGIFLPNLQSGHINWNERAIESSLILIFIIEVAEVLVPIEFL